MKIATLDTIDDLTKLNAITATDIILYSNTTDPVVLDLDHNGFSFSSLENGVSFDINADGAKDQIAWTANGGDGILALDVNGSGKIESGKELFTPTFNGGHFADGIAALASLDGNHDGVIDSQDQAFGDLTVWQDINHNGVSETGELAKLGDLGISSISLTTTSGAAPIDGQHVAGTGSFTYADGTTGTFVEVDLDASSAPRRLSLIAILPRRTICPHSQPWPQRSITAGAISTSARCISLEQITLRRRRGRVVRPRIRERMQAQPRPLRSRSCMNRQPWPCSWRRPKAGWDQGDDGRRTQHECCEPGPFLLCMGLFSRFCVQALLGAAEEALRVICASARSRS